MTRTRIHFPLPVFLLAAAVVAITAFGVTRWIADGGAGALPPLDVATDSAAAAPGALDGAKVFRMRVDTVVSISATIDGNANNGSGVVVDATNGTVITASHVVKDYPKRMNATSIVLHFHSGDEVEARVATIDQYNDLAVLSFDPAQVKDLVAAPLAKNSDTVAVGSEILEIGAPYSYEFTPTWGHVSQVHRVVPSRINGAWQIPDAIQHDASTNPGNSGGPIFNARGEVIGISQQIAGKTAASTGVGFAVSSNIVQRLLTSWKDTGGVQYAWLGLDSIKSVSPQLNTAGGLGTDTGAMVQAATGPANAAGLGVGRTVNFLGTAEQTGDVIVALAGRPVRNGDDLLRIAGAIPADQPVQVTYVRYGHRATATITPQPRVITAADAGTDPADE
ncbi:MAG: hypothetical protein JWM98_65 [Thermoleophilia bacterium]|nr:hypothetical protein [Thermoleophilia bacterium]